MPWHQTYASFFILSQFWSCLRKYIVVSVRMNSQLSSEELGIDLANNFHTTENVTLSNDSMSKWSPSIPFNVFSAIMFIIFETIGNFLLFCMIIYEKYGMDSQKRTITNMLLSSICYILIVHNLISISIFTIDQLSGFQLGKSIEHNSHQICD